MVDYSQSAVYAINKFLTESLRDNNIIPGQSSYTTQLSGGVTIQLPVFTPVQQDPEQTTVYDTAIIAPGEEGFISLPFANYTVAYRMESDQPYMTCGQVTYIFYSHDVDKLMEIANYVLDLCKRQDLSAADINQYLSTDTTNPFNFHDISVTTAGGPMESESEGGRKSFMIVVSFEHTYDSTLARDPNAVSFSGGQAMWS